MLYVKSWDFYFIYCDSNCLLPKLTSYSYWRAYWYFNITSVPLTSPFVFSISELSMGWSQEYVFWSIDRSLQQILQHLENARSTLMEMSLQESRDLSSSSVSDIVGCEAIPPSCYCTTGNHSSDPSMSSVSSSDSLDPSYLPVFPEGTTWQFRSHSLPALSRKELSAPRSQGSSLPTFQL